MAAALALSAAAPSFAGDTNRAAYGGPNSLEYMAWAGDSASTIARVETPAVAAQADTAVQPLTSSTARSAVGPMTRQQVRDDLMAARRAGTLSSNGEAGDTREVLMARERFNAAQADTIMAEYRADHDRIVAMQEAEMRRAAIEAEAADMQARALLPGDAPASDVQVDIIDMSGSQSMSSSFGDDALVVVTVDGPDGNLQHQRVEAIRQRMMAAGAVRSQIYVEASGA